jgi:hypothetical protein
MLPKGDLAVELSDGYQIDVPREINFENGPGIDIFTCAKEFTLSFPGVWSSSYLSYTLNNNQGEFHDCPLFAIRNVK